MKVGTPLIVGGFAACGLSTRLSLILSIYAVSKIDETKIGPRGETGLRGFKGETGLRGPNGRDGFRFDDLIPESQLPTGYTCYSNMLPRTSRAGVYSLHRYCFSAEIPTVFQDAISVASSNETFIKGHPFFPFCKPECIQETQDCQLPHFSVVAQKKHTHERSACVGRFRLHSRLSETSRERMRRRGSG